MNENYQSKIRSNQWAILTQSQTRNDLEDDDNECNIGGMLSSITEIMQTNKQIYKEILQISPQYYRQLHKPNFTLQGYDYKDIRKKYCLIRQLNILEEQRNHLTIDLNSIINRIDGQKYSKELKMQKQCNLYMFLRTVWKRKTVELTSSDQIEKISKCVAYIKGHIQSLLKKQSESLLYSHEAVRNSSQYKELLQAYEGLIMERQDYDCYLGREAEKYKKLEDQMRILQIQNTKLKKESEGLKQKNRNLQKNSMKTQLKISTLEEELYNKNKQIDKVNRQKKYIFTNPNYQIHILSKDATTKISQPINKTLTNIIEILTLQNLPETQLISSNKSIQLQYNANLMQNNGTQNTKVLQNANIAINQIKKRINGLQIPLPHSSRNLIKNKQKSMIMEMEAKKAKFVRQSSRNGRQNTSIDKSNKSILIKSQTFLQE